MIIQVNDTVEILRLDIASLRHTARPWIGTVTSRDGEYIMVQPVGCKWTIELYPNEVKKI